ncbi:MAG TPA: hypothetical protein VMZ66_14905 [Aeromicrobium sp.]|nr:hypothetical protein [Aeromicrobium sp.]
MGEDSGMTMLAKVMPVLDGTDTLYVAIRSASGPHVTPELFTVSGGRILCLTSAAALKTRRSKNGGLVGLCASSATGSVVLTGSVEVVDPTSLRSALAAPSAALQAPLGVARFVRDNVSEMVGATIDTMAGRLGRPLPPHRVVLAFTPKAALVTEAGAVRFDEGWDVVAEPGTTALDDGDEPPPIHLTEIPGELGDLAVSGPAVVGWFRTEGAPIALPVQWDADQLVARLPLAVFEACGASMSGPACITFDGWTGYGPSGKQGVMLRGAGTASRDGETVRITMEIGRASYWDGTETGTVDVADGA